MSISFELNGLFLHFSFFLPPKRKSKLKPSNTNKENIHLYSYFDFLVSQSVIRKLLIIKKRKKNMKIVFDVLKTNRKTKNDGLFLFHEFNFTHANKNTKLIRKYRFSIFVLQRAQWKTIGRAISCFELIPDKKLNYDIYTDLKGLALRSVWLLPCTYIMCAAHSDLIIAIVWEFDLTHLNTLHCLINYKNMCNVCINGHEL